jgi:hypothetical protein
MSQSFACVCTPAWLDQCVMSQCLLCAATLARKPSKVPQEHSQQIFTCSFTKGDFRRRMAQVAADLKAGLVPYARLEKA